jgi:tRNA U34 5-carboxymethylaminomethyl modifying GTPase MnmE/TrmE
MTGSVRDTIFALSSGRPPAAVAVVRISGPRAGAALAALTGKLPAPRQAALVRVRDPQSGEAIDQALALWFPAPASETGEDVAELQIHGGRAVIAATLGALGKVEGLRPAEAGEFTRRAFENGKLDLTAVEGLADLVMAETEGQRRQAFRQLTGALGRRAEEWRRMLIDALALVEAGIDFADEADVPDDLVEPALALARRLGDEITAVLADSSRSERLREGLTVAIAGPPNAGKSSLLNRIARREAAIVSPYAGTTRDVIEVHLDLDGWPVTLVDTAGIRATGDPVEMEGVRRARARAAAADIVLWVVDAHAWPGPAADARIAGARSNPPNADESASVDDRDPRPIPGSVAAAAPSPEALHAPAAALAPGKETVDELLIGSAEAQSATAGSPMIWLVRNKIDLLPPGTGRPGAIPSPEGAETGSFRGEAAGERRWSATMAPLVGSPPATSAGTAAEAPPGPAAQSRPAGEVGAVSGSAPVAAGSPRAAMAPGDERRSRLRKESSASGQGDAEAKSGPASGAHHAGEKPGGDGLERHGDGATKPAGGRRAGEKSGDGLELRGEGATKPTAGRRADEKSGDEPEQHGHGATKATGGGHAGGKSGGDGPHQTKEAQNLKKESIFRYSANLLSSPEKPGKIAFRDRDELKNNNINTIFNISAKTGEGVEALLSALASQAEHMLAGAESALISRARHRRALEEAAAALRRACAGRLAEDLLAEELREAARALGRLTGRVDVEEVLDVIFRDFCIGK